MRAPAKVNLYLEILGRRANGYHELRSIVLPVSLCDVVTLEAAEEDIETVVEGNDPGNGVALSLPDPAENLATRAARLLRETTGHRGGARIRLKKNIPVGGGLGGGSADAAAVLLGLNQLWRTGLPVSRLLELAAQVGCDIPALIQGGPVLMEGLGDRVAPIPVTGRGWTSPWWVVIVNPCFSISTRDIYSRYTTPLTSPAVPYTRLISAVQEGDFELAAAGLYNGLQETAFRKYALLPLVAEALGKAGARGVLLCGSGSSLLGMVECEAAARAVEARCRALLQCGVWSTMARILPDGVMAAHGPLEA